VGDSGKGEVLAMSLLEYQDKLGRLNVNLSGGRASPHKICMLLSVLDLARGGGLTENKVVFDTPLLERYSRFFNAVRTPSDHPNPYFPYFHLAGKLRGGQSGFWHLHPLYGRETVLSGMTTARSFRDITENIDYASLDPELFLLLQAPDNIDALGQSLAQRWFDRGLSDLQSVVSKCTEISLYEHKLRSAPANLAKEATPPDYVRDPAFRRVVTQMYDYRCAATGVRLLLPSGEALVEAAHIHPFHEAGDDDPRNGLALTPDMHWAFDRSLIAPGPDLKWHVSSVLDARVPDFAALVGLEGKPLLPPKEARMFPKREVLEWRMERLRESGSA
jgi:putative restriction endonuclease